LGYCSSLKEGAATCYLRIICRFEISDCSVGVNIDSASICRNSLHIRSIRHNLSKDVSGIIPELCITRETVLSNPAIIVRNLLHR